MVAAIEGDIDLTLLIMGSLLLGVTVTEDEDVRAAGNLLGVFDWLLGDDLLMMALLIADMEGKDADVDDFCKEVVEVVLLIPEVGVVDILCILDLATDAAACCLASVEA